MAAIGAQLHNFSEFGTLVLGPPPLKHPRPVAKLLASSFTTARWALAFVRPPSHLRSRATERACQKGVKLGFIHTFVAIWLVL